MLQFHAKLCFPINYLWQEYFTWRVGRGGGTCLYGGLLVEMCNTGLTLFERKKFPTNIGLIVFPFYSEKVKFIPCPVTHAPLLTTPAPPSSSWVIGGRSEKPFRRTLSIKIVKMLPYRKLFFSQISKSD